MVLLLPQRTQTRGCQELGRLVAGRVSEQRGYHAHAIVVLEVRGAALARIVSFLDPGLFPAFGLPPVMIPDRRAQATTTALKS
jgi:hypothetical protein